MGRRRLIEAALCHPTREAHKDKLCAVCFFDQKRLAEGARAPKSALEVQQRQELMTLHAQVQHVTALAKEAKAILRENLPRYAELHMTAAEVAAANGDAKPMEWALTAIKGEKGERVVDPPKTEAGGAGIRVMIGVQIGGLPTGAGTAEVIDASEITE
jgi:hypothetical protein